eukprot:TRINITY_DN22512_c0_g2_i1.p1 TRINITY_DN22512_c0_g2~~TRINITY_DN22512_c0_g2_i1.p1  ORF type:complete len:232 (-),score=29.23 TRINITY_DN22512_c0_g2_i1:32-727(-)
MAIAKVKLTSLSTNRSAPTFSMTGRHKERLGDEAVPGPGKYGTPNVDHKFKKVTNVSFGSSVRVNDKKWKDGAPGPGAYSPFDPNQGTAMWGFGTQDRLPKKKAIVSPPPGTYQMPSSLTKRACTFAGKPEGKPDLSQGPSPGSYAPNWNQVVRSVSNVNFGSEKRENAATFKSLSDAPGPGNYPVLNELGGNITTHISPAYTMTSRRKPPRNDSDLSPGPSFTQISQFGS